MNRICLLAPVAALTSAGLCLGVPLGQLDTFSSGTTENWAVGNGGIGSPIFVGDDGPGGAGDGFLRAISTGTNGPGSRLAILNSAQWTGSYISSGITAISMDVRNSGDTTLFVRMGFWGTNGQQISTVDVVELAVGSGWQSISLDITAFGIDQALADATLSNIFQTRILSSEDQDFRGDQVAAVLDIDNIRAIPAPGAASLLALAGVAGFRRRR